MLRIFGANSQFICKQGQVVHAMQLLPLELPTEVLELFTGTFGQDYDNGSHVLMVLGFMGTMLLLQVHGVSKNYHTCVSSSPLICSSPNAASSDSSQTTRHYNPLCFRIIQLSSEIIVSTVSGSLNFQYNVFFRQ